MTLRAVVIGLLIGTAIAAGGYFNDFVLKQTAVANDLLPVSAYGLLVVGLLLANPLLALLGRRQLAGSEWAVVLGLVLVACVIPGPGLMNTFSESLTVPFRHYRIDPVWRDRRVLDYAPSMMLPDVEAGGYERVVAPMATTGLRPGVAIPWSAWTEPLVFWIPLIALSFVAGICLVLVVHRQWSSHERLRYPIAEFASSLIDGAAGGRAGIFRNRRSWLGFGVTFAILLINGYARYNPRSITIPLRLDFSAVYQAWPDLAKVYESSEMTLPRFNLVAIAVAYFLASEVSLSIGINHLVFAILFLSALRAGVKIEGGFLRGGLQSYLLFGSSLGLVAMMLYLGRRFYARVLAGAVGLTRPAAEERTAVGALRVGLLAAVGMVVILWQVAHLPLLLAAAFVVLSAILFLGVTRVSAETGMFFVQPAWQPAGILLAAFGAKAIGPHAAVALALLCVVFTIDPRVCLMPLAAHAVKIADHQRVRPGRLGRWLVLAVVVALVAGMFGTIATQYRHGAGYGWPEYVGRQPFELLLREYHRFENPSPERPQGLRLGLAEVDSQLLWGLGITGLLVPLFYVFRLRWPWWPIHPILFLVMGTLPGYQLAWSFLVGWAIKTAVSKFGGSRAYRNGKTFFVGVIAGAFAAAVFWAAVGFAFYCVTGRSGEPFRLQ